jgi:hypothetical protein
MTTEYLGTSTYTFEDLSTVEISIFVVWLDDPAAPLAAQLPKVLACPSCGNPVDLGVVHDDPSFMQGIYYCTAVKCKSCRATLHLDKTEAARRPSLQWTKRYKRA